ncbi:MAG: DeoR/GlpR family DNA-binding transcription regulator [Bacteroidota bacterium]
MRSDRISQLLAYIRDREGEVHLNELKAEFPGVSESTLRRDLDRLEEDGKVIRTYGGVRLVRPVAADDILLRRSERLPLKQATAQAALGLLTPAHHVIYLDAGTTLDLFASLLPEDQERLIVTNDPAIALRLARRRNLAVMLLGGPVNPSTLSISGPWSLEQLDTLHIDLAFMGTSGVTPDTGFTNLNAVECDLKRAVIAKARQAVVLCDSGKFDRIFPFTFARFDQVRAIVSDVPPPPALVEAAAQAGMECVLAPGP